MKTSRYSRRLHRRHLRSSRSVTLNIVPMIDVFAILVFFLLSNAALVFAKLHILEMNLPSSIQSKVQPQDLGLQVVIRHDGIDVNTKSAAGAHFAHHPEGYDVAGLSLLMQQFKQRFPASRDVVILLEPNIPYNDLVQVLDAIREAPSQHPGLVPGAELFPDVSLGDAPGSSGN